jgi:hypothetical protein
VNAGDTSTAAHFIDINVIDVLRTPCAIVIPIVLESTHPLNLVVQLHWNPDPIEPLSIIKASPTRAIAAACEVDLGLLQSHRCLYLNNLLGSIAIIACSYAKNQGLDIVHFNYISMVGAHFAV